MNILDFTYPLSIVWIFGLALGLGAFFARKFDLGWRLYWIGAATFIVSQIGHIPFNYIAGTLSGGMLTTNALFLGLSAGLWESFARYVAYGWWAKEARSWGKGLMLGAGHGGIEAMLVGALVLVGYVSMLISRGLDLSAYLPADQIAAAQQQITAYWSIPWPLSLMSAVKRTLAIISHLAFSVVVLQVFIRGQLRWLWLAVGLHALMDTTVVFAVQRWGIYASEGILAVLALINLGIIFALRRPEPEIAEPDGKTPEPVDLSSLPKIEVTQEDLEKTRYN